MSKEIRAIKKSKNASGRPIENFFLKEWGWEFCGEKSYEGNSVDEVLIGMRGGS